MTEELKNPYILDIKNQCENVPTEYLDKSEWEMVTNLD